MPDVIELLEELAERPPAWPTPVGELRARAAARRRARARAALGLAASVALVVGIAAWPDRDRTPEVRTSPVPGGLTVQPDHGLVDGSLVTLTLAPDPGGEVTATQCAAEAVGLPDVLPTEWCGSVFPLRSPAGRADLTLPVVRMLSTPDGRVDCASAPGRCVILAGDRVAPLHFADDRPPDEPLEVAVEWFGPASDGQTVQVTGGGAPANSEVTLTQCIPREGPGMPAGVNDCDQARGMTVPTDEQGRFRAGMRVFRDIYTDRWVPCEPCRILVGAYPADSAGTDVLMAPTDAPIHPTLRILEPAPYRPGQDLSIEGDGFQAGQEVSVQWCGPDRDMCGYLDIGHGETADAAGHYAGGFSLPGPGPQSDPCLAFVGACALGWSEGQEGVPLMIELPLDLSG